MAENNTTQEKCDNTTILEMTKNGDNSFCAITLSNEQFETFMNTMLNNNNNNKNNNNNNKPNNSTSSFGNPGPLGLAAFALTTFMLSVFNAGSGLIDIKLEKVVLPVALFYGGAAQFAAGMWEFAINNTFGAVAFTSYGAFWMSFAGYVYFIVPLIVSTGKAHCATGLFLLSWFIFTIYMNVASYKVSRLLFILFSILNVTFLLLIIGNLKQNESVIHAGGWFGIFTAFIAWYGSAAMIINHTFKSEILPLGHVKH